MTADDALALRFHMAREMATSPYLRPVRAAHSFLWRSPRRCVATLVFVAIAVAAALALRSTAVGLVVVAVPTLLAWLLERHERAAEQDLDRPWLWHDAAHAMLRHVLRTPGEAVALREHGMDVLCAINDLSRPAGKLTLGAAEVAAMLAVAAATTCRNRLIVLAYVQLLLLAQAERLRTLALHDRDRFDEADLKALRNGMRRLPRRGRRPVSVGTLGKSAVE